MVDPRWLRVKDVLTIVQLVVKLFRFCMGSFQSGRGVGGVSFERSVKLVTSNLKFFIRFGGGGVIIGPPNEVPRI